MMGMDCINQQTRSDLISRQAAIDSVQGIGRLATLPDNDAVIRMSAVEYVLYNLPSAQPEIVRCKDCEFWREHKYAKEPKRYLPFCGLNAIYTKSDDFCSKGERRTDEQT